MVRYQMKIQSKIYRMLLSDELSCKIARSRKYFWHDLPDFDIFRFKISLILTNGREHGTSSHLAREDLRKSEVFIFRYRAQSHRLVDLQDYLDSHSGNGVIYFSLGSQIDPSTIPSQVFAALYRAFEQVPQQILWKCAKGRENDPAVGKR